MSLPNPPTPQLLLSRDCDIVTPMIPRGDGYRLELYWQEDPKETIYLSKEMLKSWDARLLEVIEAMQMNSSKVDPKLVFLTLLSHWSRKNHQVDPALAQENSELIHSWMLDQLVSVTRCEDNVDMLNVEIYVYKVDKTPNGTEYAGLDMMTTLKRPVAWLDEHFKGGSAILSFGESIAANPREIAGFLNEQYLPVLIEIPAVNTLPQDLAP